jgi:UDP-2,3-diacylglucosamine hydrolase
VSHKVYFASDLHLGSPDLETSKARERKFVAWLDKISPSATEIHLLGDMFDFWFEYRQAVPKGGVRLLGTLAKIIDSGTPVHYHVGNHDLWTFGYLEEEIGLIIHRKPIVFEWDSLKCMVGHGDGLGPGDRSYKFLKKLYENRICIALLKIIHPDIGIRLAQYFSRNSRVAGGRSGGEYISDSNELLHSYCVDVLKKDTSIDCFIFGHRHLPLDLNVPYPEPSEKHARYINTGDWVTHFSWACVDNGELELHK